METRKASSRKAHAARRAGTLAMTMGLATIAPIVHASSLPGTPSGSTSDPGADGWQILAPAETALPINNAIPPSATSTPISSATATPAPASGTNDTVVTAQPDVSVSPFTLEAGQSLQIQLAAWAKRAGWSVIWNVPDDWIVPGDGAYGSDFPAAVGQVVEALASNGADVRADVWTGNRAVVIHQNGAAQ